MRYNLDMSNTTELKISYDGDSLQQHKMDVKDLAPALISMGELFEKANYILNKKDTSLKVQIQDLEAGSFGINLEITQKVVSQISSLLSGDTITSVPALKDLIFAGKESGTGLINLIRKLKGGKPDSIKNLKNGYIELVLDGKTVIVQSRLLHLFDDIGIRKSIENIMAPLENKGVSDFKVIEKDNLVEHVKEDEIQFFKTPILEDEKISDYEQESAYSIISLAFREDNKWRLYDGSSTISVKVLDKDFLKKVEANYISFTKGDILICRVKTIQWHTTTGLKTEYELLEVINHKKAGRQLSMSRG